MTTIAIVGTGPSAIYALQGLLGCRQPLVITLFEAGKTAGVGTPYDPRLNTVEMLANIASVDIPPVGETLLEYLSGCDDAALQAIGVSRAALSEREFYPRIALGAYYRDRLAALVSDAPLRGHTVTVMTQSRVVDVIPTSNGVELLHATRGGRPRNLHADKVILATGHVVPLGKSAQALSNVIDPNAKSRHIGIIGSSLSAIDVVVSAATARGGFDERGYVTDANALPFLLTMMSRGGRLPEADFFCPLPAEPLEGFTEDDVLALVEAAAGAPVLDRIFARFAAVLARQDSEYAVRIGLEGLTADSFPDAYFAERDGHPPFAWARLNLAEARLNHRDRHVVAWRYAILRCHEAFASCLDALADDELARFNRGLKRVFADNYAAVPPRSIERLLALHDAGILDLVKLEDGYDIAFDEEAGHSHVTNGAAALVFDEVVDARGQANADEDEFPFPTLRVVLKANRDLDDDRDGGAVSIDASYRLVEGANTLHNIWCLSLPFLLDRKPFIQGLTSAADMGAAAAQAIIGDLEEPSSSGEQEIENLINAIAITQPVMVSERGVILLPKTTNAAL